MMRRVYLVWLVGSAALLLCACPPTEGQDPCAGVRCGAGEQCEAGRCVPEGACTTDADCPDDTYECTGGVCTEKCAGVICGSGEACEPTTGDCVPQRIPCATDDECTDPTQRCDTVAGVCVAKCDGVVCNTEIGETCDPTTGECVGGVVPCDTDAACEEGQRCEDGACKGGRFYPCREDGDCGAAYECISLAPGFSFCLQPCTETAECEALVDYCAQDTGQPWDGHCYFNACGPNPNGNPNVQATPYLGDCDAAGMGDGICVGPFNNEQGMETGGVCLGGGQAMGAGAACDPAASHGDPLACEKGYFCAGDAPNGFCLPLCGLFDGVDQCSEQITLQGNVFELTCVGLWGPNGLCVPQSTTPLPPGSECQVIADFIQPCEDGYVCTDDGMGTNRCIPYCDIRAPAGTPGSCSAGTCQLLDPTANIYLGRCVGPCVNKTCAPGEICEQATGECIWDPANECRVDADCNDPTLRCDVGTCVPKCDGVTCNEPQEYCEATMGTCVAAECLFDADCPDDTYFCDWPLCRKKCDVVTCDAGKTCDPSTGQCL